MRLDFAERLASLCGRSNFANLPNLRVLARELHLEASQRGRIGAHCDRVDVLKAYVLFSFFVVRVFGRLRQRQPGAYHEVRLEILREIEQRSDESFGVLIDMMRRLDERVWSGATEVAAAEELLDRHRFRIEREELLTLQAEADALFGRNAALP